MKHKLDKIMIEMSQKLSDIRIVNITTVDGFPLYTHVFDGNKIEEEKLAAVTSSITALSGAAAKQIIGDGLETTVIETTLGVMFLVNSVFEGNKCVLSVVAGKKQNIAQIRYFTFKLSDFIKKKIV